MAREKLFTNRAGLRGGSVIYQRLTESQAGFHMKFQGTTYPAYMDQCRDEGAQAAPCRVPVGRALRTLLRDPWRRIVLRWNAKAALLSAIFRGGVFLVSSLGSHHAGRGSGVLAEALFGALSAGFFGTLTQSLRFAEPQWAAEWLLAGVFPLLFQIGDYSFHAALGTQVFLAGMISSAVFTVFSAAFNLYIMRRGTLLVGAEGRSFAEDLCTLPGLALLFVVSAVRNTRRLAMDIINRGVPDDTIPTL